MKTEERYYQEGQPIKDYMEQMTKLKSESANVYEKFEVPKDGFIEQLKQLPVHFLIITEDWCGDAMMNNSVIRKVAEAANKEIRIVLRDSTDLIERHLTNGGKAIPIVLILNDEGELVGKWGPRAPELQQLIDNYRNTLPNQEHPDFENKQRNMYREITEQFSENEKLWLYVYESFKKTVLNIKV